jgi:glutamate-1-semialdehyde 2,1-aminomutase
MEIGQLVQEGWKNIAEKNNLEIEVGGIPPLSHFSFKHEHALSLKALFIQLMLEKEFLASTSFYSMYAHEKIHVTNYISAADEAMAEMREALDKGDIDKRLQGKPATSGFKRFA